MPMTSHGVRVFIGEHDISGLVTSVTMSMTPNELVTTTMVLVGTPTFRDGVLRIEHPGADAERADLCRDIQLVDSTGGWDVQH